MLFHEQGSHRYVVTQPVHAWVSSQLARNWGNEQFGVLAPRDEVILGAELHDIGWLAWEQEPTFNSDTGLPHTFMQLPTGVHLGIWGKASALARPFGRYASMLVSMHGTGLYSFHDYSRDTEEEAKAAREYVQRELDYQQSVIEQFKSDPTMAGAVSPETVARNRRLVAVWDAMSLAICGGVTSTRVIRDVPAAGDSVEISLERAGDDVSVDPWPFDADSLTTRFEARELNGTFASEREMQDALESTPWETFEVRLVRA